MPTLKSAKKALRQAKKRRAQNLLKKEALARNVKIYRRLITKKSAAEARKQLALLYKLIDKSVKTHLIARNAGRRLKRKFASELKKLA
jgi:ribosomal protein S20